MTTTTIRDVPTCWDVEGEGTPFVLLDHAFAMFDALPHAQLGIVPGPATAFPPTSPISAIASSWTS